MITENSERRGKFIYDRLYGHIEFTEQDLRIYQTKELARLRQVSLSAVPTWTIPAGVCASKFEHSVGAAHLARIVGKGEKFKDIAQDLYFATLAHDIGTPPFSHTSEHFQIKLLGKNHEEFAEDIIRESEFAKEVARQGGNIDRILNYITGKEGPMSDILNGTIDVDNLDNTLRFGISMGIIHEKVYNPEKLARAYSMRDGQLVLFQEDSNDIESWEKTRIEVYKYVYSEANLTAGAMLFRALDLATKENDLPKEYFTMTDSEASNFLLTHCNTRTQTLVERLNRWMHYPQVYNYTTTQISPEKLTYILNSTNRGALADEIANQLNIPLEDVCVYMGRNKGFKQIHIPIITNNIEETYHNPKNEQTYHAQVYVHPSHISKIQSIKEIVENKLDLNR